MSNSREIIKNSINETFENMMVDYHKSMDRVMNQDIELSVDDVISRIANEYFELSEEQQTAWNDIIAETIFYSYIEKHHDDSYQRMLEKQIELIGGV